MNRLTLEIEKVVAGGFGLARDESGVILVRGGLTGEQVLAEVKAGGKGVRRGVVTEILRAAPERVEAPVLPTADLAHASYEAQLRYKQGFVEEALARIAKLPRRVSPTVASPKQWHYRNTAQYLVTDKGFAYREREGNAPQVFQTDPLVMKSIVDVIAKLDPRDLAPATEIAFRASRLTGKVVAALIGRVDNYHRATQALQAAGVVGVSVAQPAGKRFSAGIEHLWGERDIAEQFGDAQVQVSAIGFAQINPEAAGLAYKHAAQLAGSGDHAADLYGGAGAIARHLAGQFKKVTVIDTSAEALARGRADVAKSGQHNIFYRHGDASEFERMGADVIVVDPPRAGLDELTRSQIQRSTADRLVYISCDPATWARDVGALVLHGWKLGEVTPHDFYPQTSHVEIVSLLER